MRSGRRGRRFKSCHLDQEKDRKWRFNLHFRSVFIKYNCIYHTVRSVELEVDSTGRKRFFYSKGQKGTC